MKVRKLIEVAEDVYFAGLCECGCGVAVYDIVAPDGLIYPPLSEELIKQVRPELLDSPKRYKQYGRVKV